MLPAAPLAFVVDVTAPFLTLQAGAATLAAEVVVVVVAAAPPFLIARGWEGRAFSRAAAREDDDDGDNDGVGSSGDVSASASRSAVAAFAGRRFFAVVFHRSGRSLRYRSMSSYTSCGDDGAGSVTFRGRSVSLSSPFSMRRQRAPY